MTLRISQLQYQRIQEILETAYPQEGCGVLVGKRVFEAVEVVPSDHLPSRSRPQDIYRDVAQVIPVANAWEPGLLNDMDSLGNSDARSNSADNPSGGDTQDQPKTHGAHDRYWIDPADLLRVQREAHDQGLEIIGIVHSHPDHPAVPSECDRRLAWPVYSYLIASVWGGQVTDMQSWRLNDSAQFEPEKIQVIPFSSQIPVAYPQFKR